VRKLKKREVIMVSRILEDVNFKHYAEYLLTSRLDKVLKQNGDKKEKALIIIGDITAFILQNIHKAEKSIDDLLISYCEISPEELEDMDIDNYIQSLKNVFMAGIPNIIKDIVDVNDIKKKIKSINPNQN
jgi:hypothetical protein